MRAGRPPLLLAAWLPNLPRASLNYPSRAGAIRKAEGKMPLEPIAGLFAAEIIRLLDLHPHPEGGFFRETFRDPAINANGRAVSTLIYYLLDAGQVSRWHRVDAAEVWHYYAGAALEIKMSQSGVETSVHRLGPDLSAGERPQYVVPAHCWQSAKSLGAWTLVGCSVCSWFRILRL